MCQPCLPTTRPSIIKLWPQFSYLCPTSFLFFHPPRLQLIFHIKPQYYIDSHLH
jgi:hypothetical protein